MASVNKVILIGNVGQDPDVRSTYSGTSIANLSLATTRRYKDANGVLQEETEWHRVSLFGRIAEIAQKYVTKGSPLFVEGRLRTRKYTDKQGVERFVTEILGESIQLLPRGDKTHKGSEPAQSRAPAPQKQTQAFYDDDPPF